MEKNFAKHLNNIVEESKLLAMHQFVKNTPLLFKCIELLKFLKDRFKNKKFARPSSSTFPNLLIEVGIGYLYLRKFFIQAGA